MADNLHNGHRKRLRQELLQQDFPDSVPSHKVLEALLFYGVPQKDTNEIAHELLKKFGSLAAVFEADTQSLFEVKGMTERAVTLIKIVIPLSRRIQTEKYTKNYRFDSIDEFGNYITKCFTGYNSEVFIISSFDANGNLIENDVITEGYADNIPLPVKKIVKIIFARNPSSVIVSHNHLTSNALPSFADIQMTQSLKYTLEQIEVKLVDHIIVASNDYISMAQSIDYGMLFSDK